MIARQPVDFIEHKCPDTSRVNDLLAHSQAANRWTNGGPVCQMLEDRVAELTGLRPGRAVIACCSGTAALNVLAGVHALRLGRPLRWAVSSFGFFTTFIGPFTDALPVDCDPDGMLDLDSLSRLDPSSYDGVCVTNLFGLHAEFSKYQRFCEQHAKPLIIDNAYGMIGRGEYLPDSPGEMISLHHTKPWGFGEGGCLVLGVEDEPVARALRNFGVLLEPEAAPYATNAKLSDVSAAFIMDRLAQTERWRDQAREQHLRISDLVAGSGLGLVPLPGSVVDRTGTAQIALLAPHAIGENLLDNDHFAIRKYYRPPWQPWPESATGLYRRIINLPCHADMSQVEDHAIIDVLSGVLQRAAAQSPEVANRSPSRQP